MNPKTLYRCRLTELRELTPNMRELVLDFIEPRELKFQAGQFVMLQIPQAQGKPEQRAYSIASDEAISNRLHLVIKLVPGGVASTYVAGLKEGNEVQVKGPFGKHIFSMPPTAQVLLVGTGAGISQLYSYLISHGSKFPECKYHMYIGLWGEQDLFYQKEIDLLKSKLPHFHFEYVLDKAGPTWKGKTGHVTQYLKDHTPGQIPTEAYLCGNPDMIKAVKAELAQLGLAADHVHAEAFY